MLCPEVWNFPLPKIITSKKEWEDIERTNKTITMNSFYKSLVVTFPDEYQIPGYIEEFVLEDSDYYGLKDCSLSHFLDNTFIDKFVKNGSLYCLSVDRNCIAQNCVAITPDGILTLHILDFIFQTIGLEGTKRPHNYYEIKLDLKTLKNLEKVRQAINKLDEVFNFYIYWEAPSVDICPSSIAKYFCDKNVMVSVHSLNIKKVSRTVEEIPSVKDTDLEDMIEWIGMLAIGAEVNPKDQHIDSYAQPESDFPIKSSNISLLIAKGFITPNIVCNLCKKLTECVLNRDLENYWASISIQSVDEGLIQWSTGSPRIFQSHDYSCTIFLTHIGQKIFSIGSLKYS